MIGYYGSADRDLLRAIEDHLDLIRSQMVLLLRIQRNQQRVQEKILEALKAQARHPAVALKFALGLPTRQ